MRPGFNVGVDPVDYEKPQSVADETLKFASQFGATDLIIQSYVEGAVRGEEKWELKDILDRIKPEKERRLNLLQDESIPDNLIYRQ